MRWFDRLQMRVRLLVARRSAGADLNEELRFHVERQIEENCAAGMSAEEARYAALREFGNPALLREQTRATWSWNWLESLGRDVRIAGRTLHRTPGFAAIAILVMALGIGANIALFTVVRSVLLKPLPFSDPDRLMMVYESKVGDENPEDNVVAPGVFAPWRDGNHSFSSLALYGDAEMSLSGTGGQLPEMLHGEQCSWNLLSTLGVKPAMGRDFNSSDDRHDASGTVLLSWGLWKRRFGADPGIVNQTIHLDGQPYTVIGVMPAWFAFPDPAAQLWTPAYKYTPADRMQSLGAHQFRVVGRLLPGATRTQAAADLALISMRLHDAHRDNPFVGKSANVHPLMDDMVGDLRRPLFVLLAATGCVLLIACLNVANLLLARTAARRRELAIRAAMGGGWLRLLRERLVECFLLCACGGAAGLAMAEGMLQWLVDTRKGMVRVEDIHIDAVEVAFTIGLTAVCAVLAAAVSSLKAPDQGLLATLQDAARTAGAGRARATLHKTMLAVQVGLTVVLLVAAGLLMKSYQRLRSSNLGCITDNVLTMRLDLFGARYGKPAQVANLYSALIDRVRALPGVEAAGYVLAVPGQGYWTDDGFSVVEHPPLPQGVAQYALDRWADPGYFAAMDIPMLRGRTFDSGKRLDRANEIVISGSFAKQYFSNEDPIGKHLHVDERTVEIVGIVGDTRYDLADDPKPMMYYSIYSGMVNGTELVVRSSYDVQQLALPVQRVVAELDPGLPVSDVLTMDQLLGKSTVDQSFNATLLAGFASLSLILAVSGLFGVLSYIVAQRTGEIGIRLALGARREQVLRQMLGDGLRPAIFGLAAGLAASAGVTRLIETMLFKTEPLDPWVFGAVAAVLILTATLACLAPAWRASRLNPMQALRTE